MSNTFVFDGLEVQKTGRTAKRTTVQFGSKAQRIEVLVEIQPVSTDEYQWKKWVPEGQLFTIEDAL